MKERIDTTWAVGHDEDASTRQKRLARGLMLAPAGANVVMQLARPGVGRGVSRSPLTRGSFMRHPLRRTRTTLTFMWLALYGGEDDRHAVRRAVDAQHRHVRSRPHEELHYDAFDPELQLWVAACMYVGTLQGYETLYERPDDVLAQRLLEQCSRFATTLQVAEHRWPQNVAEFEKYWSDALAQVHFEETTTKYLLDFIDAKFLVRPLAALVRPWHRLLVVGFLDSTFRDALGVSWSDRDQRRFDHVRSAMRWLNQVLPFAMVCFPWNIVSFDVRRRLRKGRSLF